MSKKQSLLISEKTKDNLLKLYSGKEYIKYSRRLKLEKTVILTGVILLSLIAALYLYTNQDRKTSFQVKDLLRNDYKEGDKSVELWVEGASVPGGRKSFLLEVNEKEYTLTELETFSKELDEILWSVILGNNESCDNVTTNLSLVTAIEGFPFDISWKSDNPLLLNNQGCIDSERLAGEIDKQSCTEIEVCLVATLIYKDYREDKYGFVNLKNAPLGEEELFDEELKKEVDILDEATRSHNRQPLPNTVSGQSVRFYKKQSYKGIIVFILGVLSAILLMMSKDKRIEEKVKKRTEEMERDYPDILNRFALYYTSGMNPRSAWGKICDGYEKKKTVKRYAYEEMLNTNRRMNEGEGEMSAYEDFAQRCGNDKYRVFANLLQQSVQKGRQGFDNLLFEEMEKARREETFRIRMCGQEAGTKLLIPMFMMLMIVLVIVLVPAFVSFKS